MQIRSRNQLLFTNGHKHRLRVRRSYDEANDVTLYNGDCMSLMQSMPDRCADLIVTSPPYNIGKEYETRLDLRDYIAQQSEVIHEFARLLSNRGSICWQVGNHVDKGAIVPLDSLLYPVFADLGMKMRNRIVWHFEHGLHCTRSACHN